MPVDMHGQVRLVYADDLWNVNRSYTFVSLRLQDKNLLMKRRILSAI